jgi:hypothetical protein
MQRDQDQRSAQKLIELALQYEQQGDLMAAMDFYAAAAEQAHDERRPELSKSCADNVVRMIERIGLEENINISVNSIIKTDK